MEASIDPVICQVLGNQLILWVQVPTLNYCHVHRSVVSQIPDNQCGMNLTAACSHTVSALFNDLVGFISRSSRQDRAGSSELVEEPEPLTHGRDLEAGLHAGYNNIVDRQVRAAKSQKHALGLVLT